MASIAAFAERYDQAIFAAPSRALYDGSDFFNVGDWSDGPDGPPRGLGEAAARLVHRHVAIDTEEQTHKASVVLDVGCGLGGGTAILASHYAQALVLGVNISAAQAGYAGRAVPAARFVVADAARMAIASGCVDRIHCIEAAFHFDTRDDFFTECCRVLRPGGKLFVTDILFRQKLGDVVPDANIWTGEEQYRRRCERAGLTVERLIDITDCTLLPFFAYLANQGRSALATLYRRSQHAYFLAVLRK